MWIGRLLALGLVVGAAALPARGDDAVNEAVAQIVAEADGGKGAGALVMSVADLGAEAAVECARHIDPARGPRNAALLEVIARAGQGRRSHAELLKLYDPAAYRLFYSKEGIAEQELIGKALALEPWPPKLAEAMVRAAPLPTLQWLKVQAGAGRPRVAELTQIWRIWGFWVRAGHERQYAAELAILIAPLAANRAILDDPQAWAALVRFAGEVRAETASGFVVDSLTRGPAAVRAEAASACRRLGSDADAAAIVRAAKAEADNAVQQKLAMAAEGWPGRDDVGAAMLGLSGRTTSAAVRREILFSCSKADWPTRPELLLMAFDAPGDGVLGAALSALSVRVEPKALEKVLEVAAASREAQPPLIDALAAYGNARATPHLIRWLEKQENPVVRVKLLLALEHTAKGETDALFLQLMGADASPMVVEQCIGIVGRKRIRGGEAVLASLALDPTAPPQVRVEAIRAMGQFDAPDVRKALAELDANPAKYFKGAGDAPGAAADPEAVDMARLMVALAKIELGDPDADAKLQAAYDRGTGMARLTALVMLAQTGRDHPIISQGLATTDTAILFGAARAAGAADPRKYSKRLIEIRSAPFVEALLESGLDAANLGDTLDEAIARGPKR